MHTNGLALTGKRSSCCSAGVSSGTRLEADATAGVETMSEECQTMQVVAGYVRLVPAEDSDKVCIHFHVHR